MGRSRFWGTGMAALALILLSTAPVSAQESESVRTFLFIGEPNAAAWAFLEENTENREALMAEPIERLGGRMLGYYWGLGDGRNYIIVQLPDDPALIQATYVARLSQDLLVSYEMIELLSAEQMSEALQRIGEVRRAERGGPG